MNRKISKFCLIMGMVSLVLVAEALLLGQACEIFVMATILLLLVSVVSYFSKKYLWLNISIALISYIVITGAILTGMLSFIAVGIVFAAACAVLEFALSRNRGKSRIE